ncbi:MAG: NAD-dependent epimerase/dehydratase family protein, partial [Leeuwenhoekiella sp.]
ELQKVNLEGTANLVNLSIANQIKKFCFVSSVAALGEMEKGKSVTEENQWDPNRENSVYSISKYASEMEVWRGTQENLDVVIVNPGIILGEGFYNSGSGKMFTQLRKGLKFTVPGGTGFVDVKDVVRAMITLMASELKNEDFILVGENLKFKTVLEKIAEALQVKKPRTILKNWQLNIAWKMDWLLYVLFDKKRKLTKSMAKSAQNDTFYDSSKIRKSLAFDFTSIDETIKRIASHYKTTNARE